MAKRDWDISACYCTRGINRVKLKKALFSGI